ncbi:MAG: hypothetical protein WC389_09165 [Lutibacter sp.]|jgi:hypothetical protein
MPTLIKKQTKQGGTREATFVGFFVKNNVASFLDLFSLAKATSKTDIVRNLLLEWYDKRDCTEEELINDIVKRSIEAYCKTPSTLTFYGFCNMLRRELKNKRISEENINIIVSRLADEKRKKKENS